MIWIAWLFLALADQFESGQALAARGDYAAAAREFESALAENPAGEKLPLTLHNLGTVQRELGQYLDAERTIRRAIAIWEERYPNHQAELASSLQNLASTYLMLGRISQAEPLYRRAYGIRRATLGDQHPLTALSLHCLAEVLHTRHRYAEADDLFTRAAALLDPNSLNFADLSQNRAMLYHDMHRDPEAKALLEGAAAVYEKSAPGHPKLAVILRNLADLDASRADTLFNRSLAICAVSLPPDHPQTAIILKAYAAHLDRTSRKKEARPLHQRARAIMAKSARETGAGATVDALALTAR
jgi:tetratricopeptide (TPR) repeat protein